jgi:hypothetical protein
MAKASTFSQKSERKIPSALPRRGLKENIEAYFRKQVVNLLYVFFWVIPRRLSFVWRCFGTLCLLHLQRQVGMKNNN